MLIVFGILVAQNQSGNYSRVGRVGARTWIVDLRCVSRVERIAI
jgi:hypothetical protein